MSPDPDPPVGVDVTKPSFARVYDYLLGGTTNYVVDREHADRVLAVFPELQRNAVANRAFMGRTVGFLARTGFDQFLDVGSGLPTADNVHQIAQRINPDALVQYVDYDPIVLAHGRALLEDDAERTAYIEADVRDPQTILASAKDLLDFSRPIALLFTAVLHYVPEDPAALVAEYTEHLPEGSALLISHVTSDDASPELLRTAGDIFAGNFYLRTTEEIRALFQGWDMVDPGLVDVQYWRPEQQEDLTDLRLLGGIALKPRRG